MRNNQLTQTGFTLIETLLYIVLFSILMTGVIGATFSIHESILRNQTMALLEEEGIFLLGKIRSITATIETVDTPLIDTSGNSLRIVTKNSEILSLSVSSDGILLLQQGSTIFPLNNENTKVAITFIHDRASTITHEREKIISVLALTTTTPHGSEISAHFSTTQYVQ